MPISDIFTGTGTATVSSASATPIASLVTGASIRAFVIGVRVSIGATSYSSGAVLFQLNRVSNASSIAGATSGGGVPNDAAYTPSLTETFLYAGSAYGTAPTSSGAVLWQQQLPQTTGSSWEEFPPLGYEYVIGFTAGVALFVTAAGTAASQTYNVEIVWSH
jgi:hypothetical protein